MASQHEEQPMQDITAWVGRSETVHDTITPLSLIHI